MVWLAWIVLFLPLSAMGYVSGGLVVYEAGALDWQFVRGQPTTVSRGELHDICGNIDAEDSREAIILSGVEDIASLAFSAGASIEFFGVVFPRENANGYCGNPTIVTLDVSSPQLRDAFAPKSDGDNCEAACDTPLASYSLVNLAPGDSLVANVSAHSKIAIFNAKVTLESQTSASDISRSSQHVSPPGSFTSEVAPSVSPPSPSTPTAAPQLEPGVSASLGCWPESCATPFARASAVSIGSLSVRPSSAGSSLSAVPVSSSSSIFLSGSLARAQPSVSQPKALRPTASGSTTSSAVTPSQPLDRHSRRIHIIQIIVPAVTGGILLCIFLGFVLVQCRRRAAEDVVRPYTERPSLVRSIAHVHISPPDKVASLKSAWETALPGTARRAAPRSRALSVSVIRSPMRLDDSHSLPPDYFTV